MRTFVTLALTLSALSLASCQRGGYSQQQDDANYLGDLYDYDQPTARPAHPTPRSYGSTPAERQQAAKPAAAPVAILKQINRHNEDGSYTYGFEGADGSFKIETKGPNGDVRGKYGFVDDGGKVRVVEYGADKHGFQPSGEGITVAPPTLVDETTSKEALAALAYNDYQDYQQQQARAQPPQRPAPQQPIAQPKLPVYQPQYQTAHTQAIYGRQQQQAALPKQPVFQPAEQLSRPSLAQLQSQLLQRAQGLYAAEDQQSAYRTGPVQFAPAPVQEHRAPQPQPRSSPAQAAPQGGGILDQLARDYALPAGGAAPLHDISFGYY